MSIDRLELCALLVDYCDVCISFLDSHSDNDFAKFLQICSDEKTNSSLMARGLVYS